MIKRIGLFIAKLFALVIYFLSYLFPRNKKRWLFGEAHGFNNNSKYLYLDVLENLPEIEVIWIGDKKTVAELKTKNLPACYRYSLRGIYLCLCSKVYIVSWTTGDICFYLSGGSVIVNLWHGLGWKRCLWLEPKNANIRKASLLTRVIHFVENPILYFPPKIVLSTSSFYTNIYAQTFRVNTNQCVEDIYPRVKFMLKSKSEIIRHCQKYCLDNYYKLFDIFPRYNRVILYAPTFRDTGDDFIKNSGIDFLMLDERMQKENYLMIVKFHPATKYDDTKFKNLKNIMFLDISYDLSILMPFTDMLITDYSTTLVDYMLLKKKIIIFAFDYEYYITQCRELLFPFDECIKGLSKAKNASELYQLIFSKEIDLVEAPQQLVKRYWAPKGHLIDVIKEESI